MDFSSVLGLVAGLTVFFGSLLASGSLKSFFDLHGLIVVLGGTLSAALLSFSTKDLINIFSLFQSLLKAQRHTNAELINHFVDLARKVKLEGQLSLREFEKVESDPFIKKGLALILDHVDEDLLADTMNIELIAIKERHKTGQQLFAEMAKYSPAFGLVGTLLGLVQMLRVLNDPSQIGPQMSLALCTTLYGVVFANVLFNPISFKLKKKSETEVVYKSIIIEGLLALSRQIHPLHMEEKLKGFLDKETRDKLKQQAKKVNLIG